MIYEMFKMAAQAPFQMRHRLNQMTSCRLLNLEDVEPAEKSRNDVEAASTMLTVPPEMHQII